MKTYVTMARATKAYNITKVNAIKAYMSLAAIQCHLPHIT